MKTIILTDSTSDLSFERAKKLDIQIVPLSVCIGDRTYLDGIDLGKREFFEIQSKTDLQAVTSQVNPEGFREIFETAKANNDSIVYISISSKLSGTMQSAYIAKEMCEYDNIYIVDSQQATLAEGCLVEYGCELRDMGKSAKEICDELNELKSKLHLFAIVDTLKYLIRGGRLSKSAGTVGEILNLKPIITLRNGEIMALNKTRGRKKAFEQIYSYLSNTEIDFSKPIYIGHSNNEDLAKEFALYLHKKGLLFKYVIEEIGVVIGTHAGPNCIGIAFFNK